MLIILIKVQKNSTVFSKLQNWFPILDSNTCINRDIHSELLEFFKDLKTSAESYQGNENHLNSKLLEYLDNCTNYEKHIDIEIIEYLKKEYFYNSTIPALKLLYIKIYRTYMFYRSTTSLNLYDFLEAMKQLLELPSTNLISVDSMLGIFGVEKNYLLSIFPLLNWKNSSHKSFKMMLIIKLMIGLTNLRNQTEPIMSSGYKYIDCQSLLDILIDIYLPQGIECHFMHLSLMSCIANNISNQVTRIAMKDKIMKLYELKMNQSILKYNSHSFYDLILFNRYYYQFDTDLDQYTNNRILAIFHNYLIKSDRAYESLGLMSYYSYPQLNWTTVAKRITGKLNSITIKYYPECIWKIIDNIGPNLIQHSLGFSKLYFDCYIGNVKLNSSEFLNLLEYLLKNDSETIKGFIFKKSFFSNSILVKLIDGLLENSLCKELDVLVTSNTNLILDNHEHYQIICSKIEQHLKVSQSMVLNSKLYLFKVLMVLYNVNNQHSKLQEFVETTVIKDLKALDFTVYTQKCESRFLCKPLTDILAFNIIGDDWKSLQSLNFQGIMISNISKDSLENVLANNPILQEINLDNLIDEQWYSSIINIFDFSFQYINIISNFSTILHYLYQQQLKNNNNFINNGNSRFLQTILIELCSRVKFKDHKPIHIETILVSKILAKIIETCDYQNNASVISDFISDAISLNFIRYQYDRVFFYYVINNMHFSVEDVIILQSIISTMIPDNQQENNNTSSNSMIIFNNTILINSIFKWFTPNEVYKLRLLNKTSFKTFRNQLICGQIPYNVGSNLQLSDNNSTLFSKNQLPKVINYSILMKYGLSDIYTIFTQLQSLQIDKLMKKPDSIILLGRSEHLQHLEFQMSRKLYHILAHRLIVFNCNLVSVVCNLRIKDYPTSLFSDLFNCHPNLQSLVFKLGHTYHSHLLVVFFLEVAQLSIQHNTKSEIKIVVKNRKNEFIFSKEMTEKDLINFLS
ncbi:asparagine-rich antigen [Tieghemostelium lacteum]|uniref:Asparagine-rich antigen n=1 Tax=Tieghemostelium lacteum TaxID=361077 RepID=A0A152A9H6_TIELA|nr:asparagine-rich antigen [Tieghemostelium lacteum]|eukprot:KYR02785.1 asparagine-rich antigen [Tieghemostelium lacteum]